MFAPSAFNAMTRCAAVAVIAVVGLAAAPDRAEARDSFSFSTSFDNRGNSSFGFGYSSGGYWGGPRGHRGWGPRGWRGDHLSLGFTYVAPPAYYYSPAPYGYPAYGYPAYAYPTRPSYSYSGYYPAGGIVTFSPTIRDRMSVRSRGVYYDAYRSALAAPVGEPINWRDGRINGDITTTRDGWAGERYCREFRQNIVIDGRTEEAYGTACRNNADADWEIIPN
jgi:hypothetical protein